MIMESFIAIINFNLIKVTTVTTNNRKSIISMLLMELDKNRMTNRTQKQILRWEMKIARSKTFEWNLWSISTRSSNLMDWSSRGICAKDLINNFHNTTLLNSMNWIPKADKSLKSTGKSTKFTFSKKTIIKWTWLQLSSQDTFNRTKKQSLRNSRKRPSSLHKKLLHSFTISWENFVTLELNLEIEKIQRIAKKW